MRKEILKSELDERIKLNAERLCESYYTIENVFQGDGAEWPGDKEGRALLAFVSHYKINGRKIPCMELMMKKIPEMTGGRMFFGEASGEILNEQQLSSHSWYLRGICEYYEQFHDEAALDYLHKTVEGIYLPTAGRYAAYPVEREDGGGGVSGNSAGVCDGWLLSTDVGCAFMSVDGLSHYYKLTGSEDVRELLDEMADAFDKIDKVKLKAQTHCTLTAARGLMRMYTLTGDSSYLDKAKRIFELYVNFGMTYTYQNFNWFGRGDSWTEPCAIVDSLILAMELYKTTQNEEYRTYAARIYHNGFATMQRPNGGAGTDTTVSKTTKVLRCDMYEAYFCCTMRLAEGLWYVNENRDGLYAETSGKIEKDELGRYADGDIIYAEISPEAEKIAGEPKCADGHRLFHIVMLYKAADEEMCRKTEQRIVF